MNRLLSAMLIAALMMLAASCQKNKEKEVPVTSVSLNKVSLTLPVGETISLTATVSPENATDKTLRWNSSAPSVATAEDGVVTAISEGTATITVLASRKMATCEVTVPHVHVPVESITLDQKEATLEVGSTLTLTATVNPENADEPAVSWTSSDETIATVKDGVVTAIAEGSAIITSTAGEKSATCVITVPHVFVPVESVTLDKTEETLMVGGTLTLTATVNPENADEPAVTWTSSDKTVATVADGVVTAVAEGSAIITAAAGEKSATCTVTVKTNNSGGSLEDYGVDDYDYDSNPETIHVTSVALNKDTLELAEGETETLNASILPNNATDKTVAWSSSSPTTASVSEGGEVHAMKAGSAIITVRTQDGGFEASCNVTVTTKAASESGGSLDDYGIDNFDYGDTPQDWTVEIYHDTTPWLATNPDVQSFLENVTYSDTDFSVTHITDYPGGPGTADIPPSYTVSWTARVEAGALTFRLWEGSWSQEFALAPGASEKSLTNLIPGRTYNYEVTSTASGKALKQGSFITKGRLHQIYFAPNVRNGRDLGGWSAAGGKTVAFRKIYRGGRLDGSYMNSTGKADMRAFGIKAEIDLRYEGDGVASSSPLGSDIDFFAPNFDGGYQKMIQDNPAKVAACFQFIVGCLRQNKPVYFHCLAGRDRTGTLSMLLLGLLGVDTSDLRKDYELTYFAPEYWSLHNGAYEHASTCWSFRNLFKILKDTTGKSTVQEQIEKLLLDNGVSQQDIDDYRSMMLE